MCRLRFALAAFISIVAAAPVAAEVLPRAATPAGSVIARKLGEEIRFIEVDAWRTVDVAQDLLAGDQLRTNLHGQLAILFADRTQIRLGRNTTLLVKQIGAAADTLLDLRAGAIWGRAQRGGAGLTVETPAAAAAIRGTDWSLTVDDNGRTALIVLEGLVELANEFGSVSVAQGEAAVAAIGQAPTKLVIVDADDREQMLFYLTLRDAFGALPASPLRGAEMRAELERLEALEPASRTPEQWVTIAEIALSLRGKVMASQALEEARSGRLTRQQEARLELVDALIEAREGRHYDAARLFSSAAGGLTGDRRAIAAFGGYFARALADPSRVEAPPAGLSAGPYGAIAEAYAAGFLRDIPAAIEVLQKAEALYPDSSTLPAIRAQLSLLINDREQVLAAVARALELDPDDPEALKARAHYRVGVESDLDGALADLERAAALAPGSNGTWNEIGLVQVERQATLEAERAFLRAIELDPNDPVARSNLAVLYLDQDRLEEARAQIDLALAADPSFDIGLLARGRHHMQTGELDRGVADLLAASTANPAHAQSQLLLAAGFHEAGDREAAEQATDNADRLDPNDPVTSIVRTAVAIDGYDAEAAIDHALESVRRTRARGGDYASISASRESGSLVNGAFRLQGLDAWGRYYGDVVFDPFDGSALVDQAVAGSPDPFANRLDFGNDPTDHTPNDSTFSALFQGLMLSPEMLAGRSRSANLLRRPFLEGSVGGGYTRTGRGGGWTAEAELQGFATKPYPLSFYAQLRGLGVGDFRQRFNPNSPLAYSEFGLFNRPLGGIAYLTARPAPADRVVAFLDARDSRETIRDALFVINDPNSPIDAIFYDRFLRQRAVTSGAGWSRTLGHRNVVNAALFASHLGQRSQETGGFFIGGLPIFRQIDIDARQRSLVGAVSHTYGMSDLVLRYGAEGGGFGAREATNDSLIGGPTLRSISGGIARAYVDATYEFLPNLKGEAALFATYIGGVEVRRIDPRIGIAWMPLEGHWLRGGFIDETSTVGSPTLSPIGVVGLQPNQMPKGAGGQSRTFAARWEAQWTDRLFTALDYQRQVLRGLAIPIPGGIVTEDIAKGRVDRVSATANLRLGHGLGLFGSFAYAPSRNLDATSPGFREALPYLPRASARLGVTWVHPSNVRLTLAASQTGPRAGDVTGTPLPGHWTADAFLIWEPFDKRLSLELAAYNLLGRRFDVATGVPGWGRSFTAALKARF
jgi:tetratricopeptide (TPR) repeat protein